MPANEARMKIHVSVCAVVISGLLGSVCSASSAGTESVNDSSTAVIANGLTPPAAPPIERLARIRLANELVYSDLQNFVCNERMDRYKGPLNGAEERRIDTITSKVSFENGVEHYTDIR